MFGKPGPSALLKRALTLAERTKTESANLNREYSKYHRHSKGLFGFAVLLTWAHLRPGIFNLSVQFRSFIEIYMSYRYIHVMICMSMMTCSSDQHVDASNACR